MSDYQNCPLAHNTRTSNTCLYRRSTTIKAGASSSMHCFCLYQDLKNGLEKEAPSLRRSIGCATSCFTSQQSRHSCAPNSSNFICVTYTCIRLHSVCRVQDNPGSSAAVFTSSCVYPHRIASVADVCDSIAQPFQLVLRPFSAVATDQAACPPTWDSWVSGSQGGHLVSLSHTTLPGTQVATSASWCHELSFCASQREPS